MMDIIDAIAAEGTPKLTPEWIASQILKSDEAKVYMKDWHRWMYSGYHVTKRMDLETIFESTMEFTDLGLPEWFPCQEESDQAREEARAQYYEFAESPEVIAILAKYLWKRTPLELRPSDPASWEASCREWHRKFFGTN